jgi:predicted nucleic acid-binding protein
VGTLIDSSVFIAAERGQPPIGTMLALSDFVAGDYLIAAITASELIHGIYRAKTEQQRLARTRDVENIVSNVVVIPFDLAVARVHAQLDAGLRASGNKVGANDLAIAATALTHGHDIMTKDLRSFPRVPGLKVLPV